MVYESPEGTSEQLFYYLEVRDNYVVVRYTISHPEPVYYIAPRDNTSHFPGVPSGLS